MLDQWVYNLVAKKILRQHLSSTEVNHVLTATRDELLKLPASKNGYGIGTKYIIGISRKNIALYRAMIDKNMMEQDAKLCIDKINWEISKSVGSPMRIFSIVKGRNPASRLDWTDYILWKFLFTKPFKREFIASDADMAFDIRKCPIQEYYRSQESIDLCYYAACKHDYKLAEKWKVDFKRTQTLANGDEKCDFKFYIHGG